MRPGMQSAIRPAGIEHFASLLGIFTVLKGSSGGPTRWHTGSFLKNMKQKMIEPAPVASQTVQDVVNAVLYEGYILYPYRATTGCSHGEKSGFGRIYPEMYLARGEGGDEGGEPSSIQAQVLLETGNDLPNLEITVGFLQPVQREIAALPRPVTDFKEIPEMEVEAAAAPGAVRTGVCQSWLEATERHVMVPLKTLQGSVEAAFDFEPQSSVDSVFDERRLIVAVIRRSESRIAGRVIVKSQCLKPGLFKIGVQVMNESPVESSEVVLPERALMQTMASAHIIFQARHGRFISLLDTPPELKFFSQQCRNLGVWPVLIGDDPNRECQTMLASPILLSDFPKVAAGGEESNRDCDSAEGDAASAADEPAERTLEVFMTEENGTCEIQLDNLSQFVLQQARTRESEAARERANTARNLPRAHFSHDDFFSPRRSVRTVRVRGVPLTAGDCVLIRPTRHTDAIDVILDGKSAVIEAIEEDAQGRIHLALVLRDEAGSEPDLSRARRFFYRDDEVEPCKPEDRP
jgi:hypothetical protein